MPHKGYKQTIEHRENLSEIRKLKRGKDTSMWGKKHSKEAIEKMVKFRTGRKMLDEWHQTFGERQMGENNHNWKGGIKTCDGYIELLMPEHPSSNKKGYIREHRLIAEEAIGRPLKKSELVHHVNGIKDDNRNCNLIICDWSYHNWLEQRMAYLYKKEHFQCQ